MKVVIIGFFPEKAKRLQALEKGLIGGACLDVLKKNPCGVIIHSAEWIM